MTGRLPGDLCANNALRAALKIPPVQPGQRIGLFGGSFNPPHRGHRHVALSALTRLSLDRVWWLVSPGNPLKSHDDLSPLGERLALTKAMARHPRMAVTAFEAAVGTRYSADTVEYLRKRFSDVRFVWVMGADNLAGLHQWQAWRHLISLVPMAVVDRPGAALPALSSPAAHAFQSARLPEGRATQLPLMTPPAWAFLHVPLDPASSTALRSSFNGS
ncbi:MAG: nicotinate-nucleotide adenylyltransferase [Pseudomonadota bacterium]